MEAVQGRLGNARPTRTYHRSAARSFLDQRHSEALGCSQRHSEAVRDNQGRSEAIRSAQNARGTRLVARSLSAARRPKRRDRPSWLP